MTDQQAMAKERRRLILASASPRRRQLLELAGIPFEVRVSHAPETTRETSPGRIAEELSFQKAQAVYRTLSDREKQEGRIILGADTIVWQDGQVLGKPKDEDDARRMLHALSGNVNSVFTGVTLICAGNLSKLSAAADESVQTDEKALAEQSEDRRRGRELAGQDPELADMTVLTFHCETIVRVNEMDEEEIEWYISTGEPFDKAGAYGIQGPFAVFVKEISGDYHNVVGLPVAQVYQKLRYLNQI